MIANTDPITVGRYANEKELLDTPQWKRFKRFAKDAKHIFRLQRHIKAANARHAKKFKFGIEIPRTYLDALRLDRENGNTLWADAVGKELGQIGDYRL